MATNRDVFEGKPAFKYMLMLKAKLHGCSTLQPMGGVDNVSLNYWLKIRCTVCQLDREGQICMNLQEPFQTVMCECGCKGIIQMEHGHGYANQGETKATPLMLFICADVEPIDHEIIGEWRVAVGNGVVQNIELRKGDCATENAFKIKDVKTVFRCQGRYRRGSN